MKDLYFIYIKNIKKLVNKPNKFFIVSTNLNDFENMINHLKEFKVDNWVLYFLFSLNFGI